MKHPPDYYLPEPDPRALTRPSYIDVSPGHSGPEEPGQNVFYEYWDLIRQHKVLLAVLAVLGTAAGLVAYAMTPPLYHTSTTMELQGFNESFMNMQAVDPQAGTGSYTPTGLNIATQIKIIESASVKGPVMDRLERELTPVMLPQNAVVAKLRAWLRIEPQDPLENMKRGLGTAISTLTVRALTGTRIIMLSAESTTPEVAASFLNALAQEYISQNSQSRSTSTQKTTQWLEGQIEETKAKLTQSEARLSDFVRKSGTLFVADQNTLADSKVKQLQGELATIQSDRIAKQSRYEMVKSSPPDALGEVIDDVNLRDYRNKLATLKSERAQLLTTLTAEHYKVKRVDAQIAEISAAQKREQDSVVQRVHNEYQASLRRERMLSREYSSQSGTVLGQTDKVAEYGLLKREVDIMRSYLNNLIAQVNQASVVSAVPTTNVRVIDVARAPSGPYAPEPLPYTAYGLGGGLAAGLGFVILRDKWKKIHVDRKFGMPGRSTDVLNVPELGVIPSADGGEKRLLPQLGRKRRVESPLLVGENGTQQDETDLALAGLAPRPALMADSFRLVLTSITMLDRNGQRPTVILVTSPGPGEGKTTVLSNLAITMAEAGSRVLIVDADLRRPRLHQIFGVENQRGLSDLILETSPMTVELVRQATQTTRVPGVSLLSSGSPASTMAIGRLFNSNRFPALLLHLRREFDAVLIDTPPMLQFSEARLLGRLTDGVILVVRSGATERESAMASSQRLLQDGIPVLGTVLNDWDPKTMQGRYMYNRYYHYYTQQEDQ